MTNSAICHDKNDDNALNTALPPTPACDETIRTPQESQYDASGLNSILEQSSSIINIDNVKNSLNELAETHNDVTKIKKQINTIVENMAKNQSMLTRAALFWGNVPLWQKIGIGFVLIAPLLILGIALNLFTLITLSALTLVGFIPGSIILENHYQHDEQITERLKDAMNHLAESLIRVIQNMEQMCDLLGDEIIKFQTENEQLGNTICNLSDQVIVLTRKAEELRATEQELRAMQLNLEQTDQLLKQTLAEKTQFYEQIKTELTQINQNYELNQQELTQKTMELEQIKKDMGQQLANLNTVALALQKVVENFADQSIKSVPERELFQTRLNEFVTDRKKSLEQVTKRITESNQKLQSVQEQLDSVRHKYQELLKKQGSEIHRIEQTLSPKTRRTAAAKAKPERLAPQSNTHHLKKLGLHAKKKPHRVDRRQHQESAQVKEIFPA
ncbi:LegC2/C7 family Dot/Icm T4SS effector [Legionella worsleiensis]|uniref:Microtubule binding protein n=1 Tax=Legionella worsleiensis TaxID=45076 RepID=A0A0W1A679_9GAMM|nr:LegC2/C7 family Dot/Icm T4SS effector [Legionella worsleiensis]KTD76760.1 microtubule binding protein [Legionella worsleiensis]STY30575.1 microtubule binding protein, putative [Legionella worsleiensis]